MRRHEVESWVLDVVDLVRAGHQNEDSRIELKADWVDARTAARRIAGHANAARGAPILWIVGLDQFRGVVGARHEDLAEWWPQVSSWFDGVAPELHHDLIVPVGNSAVVALLMSTVAIPYVVRNPDKGPDLEVPWREGTRIRAAKREDLVRLLSPVRSRPSFEVLAAEAILRVKNDTARWDITAILYQERLLEGPAVIPFHRCRVTIHVPGLEPIRLDAPTISPQTTGNSGLQAFGPWRSRDATVAVPSVPRGQVTLSEPVRLEVGAFARVERSDADVAAAQAPSLRIRVEMDVIDLEGAVVVDIDATDWTRQPSEPDAGNPRDYSLTWTAPGRGPTTDWL